MGVDVVEGFGGGVGEVGAGDGLGDVNEEAVLGFVGMLDDELDELSDGGAVAKEAEHEAGGGSFSSGVEGGLLGGIGGGLFEVEAMRGGDAALGVGVGLFEVAGLGVEDLLEELGLEVEGFSWDEGAFELNGISLEGCWGGGEDGEDGLRKFFSLHPLDLAVSFEVGKRGEGLLEGLIGEGVEVGFS